MCAAKLQPLCVRQRWRKRSGVRASKRGLTSLTVILLAGACVGPSLSDQDYRQKAANSAEAMRSAVETAKLVSRAAIDGKASGRYTSLALSEAEVDAGSIAESFKSVQPPSRRVHQLRDDLSALLDESSLTLASLRVAAYRGDEALLVEVSGALPRLSSELSRFEHLVLG